VAGAGSEAQYQDILQSLAFESRTAHPKETLRKVSITVYDERGLAGGSAEISTTIGVEDGRGSKGRSDALVASKETDGFLGLDDASLDFARADASPGANAAEDAGVFDSVIQNGSAGGRVMSGPKSHRASMRSRPWSRSTSTTATPLSRFCRTRRMAIRRGAAAAGQLAPVLCEPRPGSWCRVAKKATPSGGRIGLPQPRKFSDQSIAEAGSGKSEVEAA
jgi:hypothetical protein